MRKITIKLALLCVMAIPSVQVLAIDWTTTETVKKDGVDVAEIEKEAPLTPFDPPRQIKELFETIFVDPANFPGNPISPEMKKPSFAYVRMNNQVYKAILFGKASDAASLRNLIGAAFFGGTGTLVVQVKGDPRFGLLFTGDQFGNLWEKLGKIKKQYVD